MKTAAATDAIRAHSSSPCLRSFPVIAPARRALSQEAGRGPMWAVPGPRVAWRRAASSAASPTPKVRHPAARGRSMIPALAGRTRAGVAPPARPGEEDAMKPGFFDRISQREVALQCGAVKSPSCYYDASAVTATFTASTARIAALLPDGDLHPVELRRGRALLTVTGFEHRRSDIGPYREVLVAPLVVFGRRPLRVVDALAAVVRRSMSLHVLHLAVTTELARAVKTEMFGFATSVADVACTRGGGTVQWTVAEGGKEILTLTAEDLPAHAAGR